jgi:hypothetical protein
LLAVTKDLVQEWDRGFAEVNGTAAPGRRADDEAAKRCMFFENDIDGLQSKIYDFENKIKDLNTNELKLKEVINDM